MNDSKSSISENDLSNNYLLNRNEKQRKPKPRWVIESPGLLRKKSTKIFAEAVIITHDSSLLITIDASKGHYMGISCGNWSRFYPEDY